MTLPAVAERASPPPVQSPISEPSRSKGRGRLLLIIAVLIVSGLLLWRLFFAAPSGGTHHGNPADMPQPVGTARVVTGDLRVVLSGLGTVTPLATVTVQTQISGQLLSVGYQEGQLVKAGDFLAQVDPRPYEVALAQAQGTLARDQALLAQAKSDLARYIALNRKDSIAVQQVADQQFLVQQDQGTVRIDQAAIDSARLNLAYCHITSPISGRVGLRLVDPGNYVQTSSSTGLVVITELQPVSVIFVLPEDNVPEIARQMHGGTALPVDAYDRTDTKVLSRGALSTVDNTVDTTTGTVKLRATFSNTDFGLFPNQFVNAHLLLRTLRSVTIAPTAAIQHGEPGSFVYLVKPGGTVGVQVVQTGVIDGDQTQITAGLKPNDEVVVDGADRLKDGAKIRVSGAAAAANGQEKDNTGPGAPPGDQPAQHQHHRHKKTPDNE